MRIGKEEDTGDVEGDGVVASLKGFSRGFFFFGGRFCNREFLKEAFGFLIFWKEGIFFLYGSSMIEIKKKK